MSDLLPCSTCAEHPLPELLNEAWGMRYRCPKCMKLGGPHWADELSAREDWNPLNDVFNIIARDMIYGRNQDIAA